jgi:hypothetical protein
LYALNHNFYKRLSLFQHSSENDCERVLPGCPINKHFSKSDKIQDFHMIVDDDPAVVDESIKFSFNNVNNEVVLVNNTSTLSSGSLH